jgi:hypothetical protein
MPRQALATITRNGRQARDKTASLMACQASIRFCYDCKSHGSPGINQVIMPWAHTSGAGRYRYMHSNPHDSV